MVSLLRTRITLVWFLLVLATTLSWGMGHGIGFDNVRHAGVAIIIMAFIKVRYVILDFMEIRHAPIFMRVIGVLWVIVVCSTLVTLYWNSPGKII